MSRARVTDTGLAHATSGDTGPWLTLIHGGLVASSTWRHPVRSLEDWARILTYDLRGYGESGPAPKAYTVAHHAEELLRLWDSVGIREGFIAGFSFGGLVAQEVALTAPERVTGLVLVSTTARLDEYARRAVLERASAVETAHGEVEVDDHLRRAFSPTFVDRQPEVVANYRRQILATPSKVVAQMLRALAEFDRADALQAIRCPTLVTAGEEDPGMGVESAREMVARIPHARLVVLAAHGHTIHVEAPSTFSHLIADFLSLYWQEPG